MGRGNRKGSSHPFLWDVYQQHLPASCFISKSYLQLKTNLSCTLVVCAAGNAVLIPLCTVVAWVVGRGYLWLCIACPSPGKAQIAMNRDLAELCFLLCNELLIWDEVGETLEFTSGQLNPRRTASSSKLETSYNSLFCRNVGYLILTACHEGLRSRWELG